MKRSAIALTLLAAALAVGAALALRHPSSAVPTEAYRGSIPPPGIHVPSFRLRSYRGPLISTDAFRGRVVVVTFLDTKCTQKCPVIAGIIGAGLRLLRPDELRVVAPLAISVDPRVDTATAIRRFLRRRHALALDFLIGSVRQLRPVWRAFAIVAAAETGNADVHSADVRVFDGSGIWVSTLRPGVDLTPANLAHDVRVALGSR